MGSGGSFDDYRGRIKATESLFSPDLEKREKTRGEREKRIKASFATMGEKKILPRRDEVGIYDDKLVKLKLTRPAKGVKRVHIVLIDNSGSNRMIAEHLKNSSGYLTSNLHSIDPEAQVAYVYFSDHKDGEGFMQEVDFHAPDKEGDRILYSTLEHVFPANGYDEAEGIECVLWQVCETDFGEAAEKHLYLVTDVVAHGMGMRSDDGCPFQRDWRKSVERVYETFTSFTVIGCTSDKSDTKLQQKFLKPERLVYDHIDLSSIPEEEHRKAITGNALLFLIARQTGLQGVEMFLSVLYEKWLAEPIFGHNTGLRAKEAIWRFSKYLEAPEGKVNEMMDRILV
jgi:hypothetical protein